MTDLEQAMQDFMAKQAVTVCPDASNKTAYKELRKASFDAQKDREREENNAQWNDAWTRNAENRRYDKEGIYYIGGKL